MQHGQREHANSLTCIREPRASDGWRHCSYTCHGQNDHIWQLCIGFMISNHFKKYPPAQCYSTRATAGTSCSDCHSHAPMPSICGKISAHHTGCYTCNWHRRPSGSSNQRRPSQDHQHTLFNVAHAATTWMLGKSLARNGVTASVTALQADSAARNRVLGSVTPVLKRPAESYWIGSAT